MRRIALLGLFLLLTGCGTDFGHFISDTHTFQSNPNMPPGDAENLRRVVGEDATQPILTPEPGNIWPPPAGPMPTLMDLEKTSPPGTPGSTTGATAPPAVGYGGSPPPVPPQGLGAEPPMAMPKPSQMPTVRPSTPSPTILTPSGPAVVTGSGPGYSTTTNPGGGGNSIVVPNGNGTSTIIHADGTVETVATPK
jgi:hypothetical protein